MKMKTLTLNGTAYQVCDPAAVSFEEQTLSQEQKMQARQNLGIPEKTYELIEDVTLQEDVSSFVRTADPNGVAYNFSAIHIRILAPAATAAAQIIVNLGNAANSYFLYHQTSNGLRTSTTATNIVARNDNGLTDYYVMAGVSSDGIGNCAVRDNYLYREWGNITRINFSTYPSTVLIPDGTRIRIYAVRG